MTKCGKEILIDREGTEQQKRFIDALNPDSIELNHFSLKEWMQLAYEFACRVNYFSKSNSEKIDGNWQPFFIADDEIDKFIDDNDLNVFVDKQGFIKYLKAEKKEHPIQILKLEKFFEKEAVKGKIEETKLKYFVKKEKLFWFVSEQKIKEFRTDEFGNKNITPHLALFIAFIKLLEFTQNRFNKLTQKHLDFYYQKILNIEKLPATPDKVHILFELAKNFTTNKIEKEAQLDGGKDKNGKKLVYETCDELIVNKTKVAQLKSVYNDAENKVLKVAQTANSFNGNGKDFPDGEIRWWPFGYFESPSGNGETGTREFEPLENAKVGFAMASKIFKLNVGERNIQLTIKFKKSLPADFDINSCYSNIEIECTGEEEWLKTFSFAGKVGDDENNPVYTSVLSGDKKTLKLAFQVPEYEKAVTIYNQKVHGESFNTENPVCRFIVKTDKTAGYDLFQAFSKTEITSVKVDVNVKGVKTLSLQNDIGIINAEKPFYPFGTQPALNSKFVVDYSEMFDKSWENFTLEIKWKDTPDDFFKHYEAYRNKFKNSITPKQFSTELKLKTGQDYYVSDVNDFTSSTELKLPKKWEAVSVSNDDDKNKYNVVSLFKKNGNVYNTSFRVDAEDIDTISKGPFRLTLNRNFGHELFPKIYTIAVTKDDEELMIPNKPYTPLVEEITLDYSASENITELYHEHPFGQSKTTQNSDSSKLPLIPGTYSGGNLFIGLENAEAGQTISLLVQVLEGSENPETESFSENEKVEWSALCKNKWKALNSSYINFNETDNFLKSGIVKFSIPREATSDSTLLPSKYIWVKAGMNKKYDAVCKIIGINAQVVLAQFTDSSNELSHLKNGIKAKTISKMVKRVSDIKSISQPFSSFGSIPQETDTAFYTRVSERLRHKNRAITIWDYEHLALQTFPEIYRVKSFNHTKTETKNGKTVNSFLAPGHVTIIVIPDIINKNVFDIYQPRVSTATLNIITEYLQELNSTLIKSNLHVINPVYEEVRIDLKVKFYKGYDENYYKTVLKQDITKLLSPWAFEKAAGISFGQSYHKTVLIKYIEDLGYVDYVSDVRLLHKTAETTNEKGDEVNVAAPSCPLAVLVSAKTHDVEIDSSNCLIL